MSISPRTSKSAGMPAFFNFSQRNGKRNGSHGAHVEGDVFAGSAVAAGNSADQFAIFVMQGQRHAVELQLANIVDVFTPAKFVDSPFPVAELVFAVGVVQREHGRRVRRLEEAFAGLAAHALRGRVWGDQFGIFGFELLQLDS